MEHEEHNTYLPENDGEVLEPFDVRAQASRRGMYMLIGGFLFLLLIAAIVMGLFSGGTRARNQTPRILADNEPYKAVPADTGETKNPEEELEIYKVQNGSAVEKEVIVAPIAEEPIIMPKLPAEALPKANVVIKEAQPSANPTISQPVIAPVTAAPKPVVRDGAYVVQVASLRTQAEADALWGKLKKKFDHSTLPSHYYSDVKRANLGAKGIYYRLRISGLADKTAANDLCAQLKAQKQDCLVTRR